jgi:hypothetical protein
MDKKIFIIIPVFLFFIGFLLFVNSYLNSYGFEKQDLYILKENSNDYLSGTSPLDLKEKLMFFAGSEGKFEGKVTQFEKGLILTTTIRDDYIPDDSLGTLEKQFIAEKNTNGIYEVTEYYTRHSCKRYPSKSMDALSKFIYPLWTKKPCS